MKSWDRGYAFFWGCTIPSRFPFMESSIRLVLDKLGVNFLEVDEFICCPEKSLAKNLGNQLWTQMAAYNLALAEKERVDLLQACNGCYSTFKTVNSLLRKDPKLREGINKDLTKIGLEFNGKVKIKHLVEFLHDDLGLDTLKRHCTRSLSGMRIAIHYGCHLIRPSQAIDFDDPFVPKKFDEVIKALGATPIEYHLKMDCCGGALDRVNLHEEALHMSRLKLLELKKVKADALAVVCPACFQQFDNNQFLMVQRGEPFSIPVLTLSEIIGLAIGLSPEDLKMDSHRIDCGDFLGKLDLVSERRKALAEDFDLMALERCVLCGACQHDCPVSLDIEGFNPHEIIKSLLEKGAEEAVRLSQIWECVGCHTCTEMCPENVGFEKILEKLKIRAIEMGSNTPEAVLKGMETLTKTGKLGEARASIRAKLGLPQLPKGGMEKFKRLMETDRD